jgi:carboxypeptidase family protein
MNWRAVGICILGLFNCAFLQNPAATGSGKIQGTVCELDGCSPISGAHVAIEPANSATPTRMTTTTEAGAFEFADLPAGRYLLEAEADDFGSVATLPLISISNGGRVEDVKIFMRPLGSISGRAIDENSRPIAFARVEATSFPAGVRAAATADDYGRFRIAGLGSGQYIIRMEPPPDAPDMLDYLPVFYPGTAIRDRAAAMFIGPRTHISGIVLQLASRGVKITGRFVGDSGKPAAAVAYLGPRTTSTSVPTSVSRLTSNSVPGAPFPAPVNEGFEIRAVGPGSYFLYAITQSQAGGPASKDRVSPQWVRMPIEVGDLNIDGITVPIHPAGSIHGRVRVSADVIDPVRVDFSDLNLQLNPTEALPPFTGWNSAVDISREGAFEFVHLPEVKCSFTFLSDEWFISQLLLEGRDVTSSGFSTAPGEDRVLDVVISNAGGRLTGILKDDQDRPVPGRVVLLRDRSPGTDPAVTKITLASDAGEFHIEAISPGEYTVIAFPPDEQSTPMFLDNSQWVENYARYGQHVEITPHLLSRMDLITVKP